LSTLAARKLGSRSKERERERETAWKRRRRQRRAPCASPAPADSSPRGWSSSSSPRTTTSSTAPRDLGEGKNAHLKALENAGERLRLFKADVLDYGSVAAAIAGCDGVFHVASPVTSGRPTNPEVDIIATAVTGTLNVLRASHEAKVKRVVVVSSVVAVFNNPNWPTGEPFNEDSWSDEETCRKNEEWYPYYLSNTLAEREAFEYAAKTGMDIVTICPALIIGPLMQPTVPTSIEVFFHIIKGG
ncbi:Os08g0183900, partial [Oryza sativa Japonica Group]